MKIKRVIVDEMPEGCSKCGLMGAWSCTIRDKYFRPEYHLTRPDWCPLEVETDGWIPVSEKLPEDGVLVLISHKFNGKNLVDEAIHYSSFDSGCPCWFFNGFARHKGEGEYEEFTHWRLLPEAPKEVKE